VDELVLVDRLDEVVGGAERESPAALRQHGHDDDGCPAMSGSDFDRVRTSQPLIPGSLMSRITATGRSDRTARDPSRRPDDDRPQAGSREVHGHELAGPLVVLDDDDRRTGVAEVGFGRGRRVRTPPTVCRGC
jgi:hypothetical protein